MVPRKRLLFFRCGSCLAEVKLRRVTFEIRLGAVCQCFADSQSVRGAVWCQTARTFSDPRVIPLPRASSGQLPGRCHGGVAPGAQA